MCNLGKKRPAFGEAGLLKIGGPQNLATEETFGLLQEIIHSAFTPKRLQHSAHSFGKLAFEKFHHGVNNTIDLIVVDSEGGEFFFKFFHVTCVLMW